MLIAALDVSLQGLHADMQYSHSAAVDVAIAIAATDADGRRRRLCVTRTSRGQAGGQADCCITTR